MSFDNTRDYLTELLQLRDKTRIDGMILSTNWPATPAFSTAICRP